MPSENTHIYLADRMRGEINNRILKRLISDHMDYYFLGSTFPDILFYSKKKEMSNIAHHFHGEDGFLTNRIIFELLDRIKSEKNENNLVFIFGLLTHYAADITFHQIVFYLSGYQPNGNKREMNRSSYLHWHYETSIDKQINDRFCLHRSIHPEIIKDLIILQILGINQAAIGEALKRQIKYFKLTPSRFYYVIFNALYKLGLYPASAIAGFYRNLEKERIRLPDPIQYKDLLTGETKQATLNDLMVEAVQFGCRMIETAYTYYTGRINRDECEKVIAGHSLETGLVINRKNAPDAMDYADLLNEKYKGRVSYRLKRPTLIALAFAMGDDPFAKYADADAYKALMEKVSQKMIAAKPIVKSYWSNGDALLQSMRSGEVNVAMAWDGGGWKLKAENPDIDFVAPKSGALGWIDTFALPAKSENVEGAYKWINFILKAENAAVFTNAEKYGTASAGATKLLDEKVRANFERTFPQKDIDNIKWYPPVPAKLESIEGMILDKVKAAK